MSHVDDCIGQLAAVDPLVVDEAMRGLSKVGQESLRPLLHRLEGEGDSHTRVNILRAVGRVIHENDLYDEDVVERLRSWAEKRRLTADSNRTGRHERATWIKVVGMVGDPSVIDELVAALDDDDPRVRSNAVEGLAFVVHRWKVTGGISTQQALERAQDDRVPRVSVTATVALHLVHSVAARALHDKLRQLAGSSDAELSAAARTATAVFGIGVERLMDSLSESIYSLVKRPDDWG